MIIRNSQIILALYNQLQNYPDLSYANGQGYYTKNIWDIVAIKKYPFYTIIPNDPSKRIERVDNISKMEMKRHVYRVVIQYGTYSLDFGKAIMGDDDTNFVGILDFQDDIWDAIESDPTLGGSVQGIIPDYEPIPFDMVQDIEDEGYLAGGQIELEFYNDRAIE